MEFLHFFNFFFCSFIILLFCTTLWPVKKISQHSHSAFVSKPRIGTWLTGLWDLSLNINLYRLSNFSPLALSKSEGGGHSAALDHTKTRSRVKKAEVASHTVGEVGKCRVMVSRGHSLSNWIGVRGTRCEGLPKSRGTALRPLADPRNGGASFDSGLCVPRQFNVRPLIIGVGDGLLAAFMSNPRGRKRCSAGEVRLALGRPRRRGCFLNGEGSA